MTRLDKTVLRRCLGLCALTSALPAWARPGGGSSYRSSSYRSSSSSYRSSGSSYHPSSSRPSSYRPSSSGSSYHPSSSSGSSYRPSNRGGYDSSGGQEVDVYSLFWTIFIVLSVVAVLIKMFQIQQTSSQQNLRSGPSRSSMPAEANAFSLLRAALKLSGPERWQALAQIPASSGDVSLLLLLGSPFLLLLMPVVLKIVFSIGFLVPLLIVGGILHVITQVVDFSGSAQYAGHTLSAESRPSTNLDALFMNDPNFSLPVFREFAVLLYCQAIQESSSNFSHSRPHLTAATARSLDIRSQGPVGDVVVGFCHVENAWIEEPRLKLTVRFESNYIETVRGVASAYVANESWVFSRQLGTLTRVSEGVSKLACPGCGFSGEFPSSGECPQCNRSNLQGQLDWVVTDVRVLDREQFTPHSAEGGGVEVGTDLDTVVHPQLGLRRREFFARHPEFTIVEFEKKLKTIFLAINKAWTERDWSQARPYETDSIFRTHRYWIEDYLRRGQINRLEDIRLDQVKISNIVLDAFYESITVRLYASMLDYTVDEKTAEVLHGDARRPKVFSEYWTLIRRVGHTPSKATGAQCPSCGAPLDRVNQAGACEYCQCVITKGDFDWVLSNIEQDEVYQLSM